MAGNSGVVGILRALLTLNTAEFEKGFKRADSSLKAFSREAKIIGQQATQLGQSLTRTITLPLVALGGAAAKAAIDFESSFAGVRKTVNATEAEFAAMAKQLRDLAKTIPVNVNELNRLAEAAGALGIPKDEIVDFARVMAMLGVTTNLTADQAAESIAKVQNIFGAAGKDTEKFASTLVALGNDGASTEEQILSMATRIAGAGNTIGLTQGQVLGFASALSSVGLEAEAGGTAISRVFIEMASAVQKGGAEVANFASVAGLGIAEFSRLFKDDAAAAVNAFVTGLGNIKSSGGDLLGTLEALGFSEIRVRDTLLRTAGAGDLLTRALRLQEDAWRENSALTDEARKRFETTESRLGLLWNRIKDVGITIGNALLPMIEAAIKVFDALLPKVEGLATFFASLPTPIQAVAVGLGLAAAAAGPLLFVFGQLVLSASALAGAFTRTGLASRVMIAGMSGVSIAATGTATAVSTAAVTIRTALLSIIGPIGAAAAALLALHSASQKYHIASKLTDDQIRQEIETLKKVGGQMALSRAASLEAALAARQHATATGETNTELKTLQQELEKATTDGLKPFNADVLKSADAMKEADKAAADWRQTMNEIGEAIMQAEAAILGFSSSEATKKLQDLMRGATPGVLNNQNFGLTAGLMFGPGALTGGNVAQSMVKGGAAIGINLREGIRQALTGLPDLMRMALTGGGGLGGALKAMASDIGSTITGNLFGLGGALSGATKALTGGASKLFGDLIGGAIGSFLPGVGALVGPLIGKLGGAIRSMFGGPSRQELEGRQTAEDFRKGLMAGLNEQQRAAAGNDQWKATVIAIRDAYLAVGKTEAEALAVADRLWRAEKQGADAVKQVIDEINAVKQHGLMLDDARAQKQQLLDDALARYNFTATEKGPVINQQEMAAQAEQLLNDYQLLTEAGIDHSAVLREMAGSMSEFVNRAVATGTAIPEAFREIVQQMIEQGRLLDENGNAFESLEATGLQFGDTLETMFTRVLEKLEELIAKLTTTDITIPVRFDTSGSFLPTGDGFTVEPIPQFHAGGMVKALTRGLFGSLRPGEVFSKLQVGEGVLSHAGMANLGGAGVLNALNAGRLSLGDPFAGASAAAASIGGSDVAGLPESVLGSMSVTTSPSSNADVITAIGQYTNEMKVAISNLPILIESAMLQGRART